MKKTKDSRLKTPNCRDTACRVSTLTSHVSRLVSFCTFCLAACLCPALCGCGRGIAPAPELPTASKGYIVYVFAKKTEVMIDFCKSDGLSRGTKLDVFRIDVPDMDEPVKIGEITVEKIGKKMSKAKVTVITSSLQMERGDRVLSHPVVIVSDASWMVSRKPMEDWKSDISLSDEREWEPCEVLSNRQAGTAPEIRQLIADTEAKPIWHPSVKSQRGDVFFRKTFYLDAEPVTARVSVACGGRTNIYLNDRWIGEAEKWPKITDFKVAGSHLDRGRNLIAVHVIRDARLSAPPVLFLALAVQTEFQ